MTKAEAGRLLQSFVDVTVETLGALGDVRIKALGTLSVDWHDGRVVRSPRDRRRMFLDGRHRVSFRAAERLREAVAQRSPQLWKDQRHQAAWRLAETLLSDLEIYHADKVPADVTANASDVQVAERCAAAFGAHWRRVVATFEQSVPADVRAAKNHLIAIARDRWSRATSGGTERRGARGDPGTRHQ
ncbi:MAG: HU family DNA-binding protein [Deltaproteobacteria bacterium]|nr:HU family DNA-binding protein [Deltaproteobacteria bacterium]